MFHLRLSKLRRDSGLTQNELSKRLNISRATYAQYEIGRREPDIETIQKLASFFNVSIDYIVGRVDNPRGVLTEVERELYDNIDLNDDFLLKKFKLMIDGKPVTKLEAKDFIAFVRARRAMQK